MYLFNSFFPKEYVDSVYDINYQNLKKIGIDSLIFDIDNTLAPYYEKEASEEVIKLLDNLKKQNFKICLVSNNNEERVTTFNNVLCVFCIPKAKKPSLYGINKAMNFMESTADTTAIIGDQIFTDVWCGNKKGLYTVLVKPIVKKDELSVFLKRGLEKIVIDIYLKKGKRN